MVMSESRRSPGRPREFDEAKALDGAIALFSAAGFSGASISDIAQATGLSAGSLYKAYRDKDGIYASALDRYVSMRDADIANTIEYAQNGRAGVARFLSLYADSSQGRTGLRGCMVVAGVGELDQLGDSATVLRTTLARRRAALKQLIEEGRSDGSITTAEDAGQLADVLLALLQGMRVVGKGGQFPADGDAFVRLALKLLD
jgi:TetR/AcrR family transcriptional regulator, transcriptional repressor for nem operon